MLLIISMENDFHVNYLLERMTRVQKENTIIFKTETFPVESRIVLSSLDDNSYIETHNGIIPIKDIHGVWYRRPAKPVISEIITELDVRGYAETESENALMGLWESMDNCQWVSKPSLIKNASHKWEQIKRATRIGFNVPKTLITNSPNEARIFCSRVKKAIVKAVRRSVFPRKGKYEIVYTSLIECDDERIDDVVFSPCIFQEYVSKKIELRITVVGNQVFACAIYSQNSEKTLHDWRNYDLKNTPHEKWNLPNKVEKNCLTLVKSYGLPFGAIDMILTPDDEYVFLELNPNGQWAWIEDLTNMPIGKAVIDLLFNSK